MLDGGEALAYVRDRHDFATQDLQREQDQRIFLKALLSKMTSTGVILNPFAALPAASGTVGSLTVDEGTSLYQLFGVAQAMRTPESTTVPIATANYATSVGMRCCGTGQRRRGSSTTCRPVNRYQKLITGSHQGDPSLTGARRAAPESPQNHESRGARSTTSSAGRASKRHVGAEAQAQDAFS